MLSRGREACELVAMIFAEHDDYLAQVEPDLVVGSSPMLFRMSQSFLECSLKSATRRTVQLRTSQVHSSLAPALPSIFHEVLLLLLLLLLLQQLPRHEKKVQESNVLRPVLRRSRGAAAAAASSRGS